MIEQLEELTTALKEHTAAMNNLASAMRASGEVTETSGPAKSEYDGPIYWINNKTGEYGACVNSAEWNAVKKKNADAVKVPETKYSKFIEDQEAKAAEEEEKTEKASSSKTKSTRTTRSKPKAKKEPEPEEDDDKPEVDIPEVDEEDLIKAFKGFMSQDLDKEERDERIAFVKPMLQRFGVNKATELDAEDRGIAVRLLQLKEEGFDIDPAAKDWEPLKVIAECEAESGAESDDDDGLV